MKSVRLTGLPIIVLLTLFPVISKAQLVEYGTALCGDTVNFYCIEVIETTIITELRNGDSITLEQEKFLPTWEMLWPDKQEREIVMKINRRNIKLKKGDILAVPYDMYAKTFMDYSPYPGQINTHGEKVLIWDPKLLAYAAYNEQGSLVRWGPAVGGKDYCSDLGRTCRTRPGEFKILSIEGANYRSKRYPAGCTGSECSRMSYAMFYEENYAFHSGNLYAQNASHGCVRLFYSDAQWLNQNFVEVGIKVIIRPYPEKKQ